MLYLDALSTGVKIQQLALRLGFVTFNDTSTNLELCSASRKMQNGSWKTGKAVESHKAKMYDCEHDLNTTNKCLLLVPTAS